MCGAMDILSVFRKPEATPAPPVAEDPETVLLEQLTAAQAAIDECGARMIDFRKRHCAVIGGVQMIGGETTTEAVAAKAQWDQMMRELSARHARHQKILEEWSRIPKRSDQ